MSLKEVDELSSILMHDENRKADLERNIAEVASNIGQQESRLSAEEGNKQNIFKGEEALLSKVESLIEKIDMCSVSLEHFIADKGPQNKIAQFLEKIVDYENNKTALINDISFISKKTSHLADKIKDLHLLKTSNQNSKFNKDTEELLRHHKSQLSKLINAKERLRLEACIYVGLIASNVKEFAILSEALQDVKLKSAQMSAMLDSLTASGYSKNIALENNINILSLNDELANMTMEDSLSTFCSTRDRHVRIENILGDSRRNLDEARAGIRDLHVDLENMESKISQLSRQVFEQSNEIQLFNKISHDKVRLKVQFQQSCDIELNRFKSLQQRQVELHSGVSQMNTQIAQESRDLEELQSQISSANAWMTTDPEVCGSKTNGIISETAEVKIRKNIILGKIGEAQRSIEEVQSKIASTSEENLEAQKNIQTSTVTEKMKLNALETLTSEKNALLVESTSLGKLDIPSLRRLECSVLNHREDCAKLTSQLEESNKTRAAMQLSVENIKSSLKTIDEKERAKKFQQAVDTRLREKELTMVLEHKQQLQVMHEALTNADNEFKAHFLKVNKELDDSEKKLADEISKMKVITSTLNQQQQPIHQPQNSSHTNKWNSLENTLRKSSSDDETSGKKYQEGAAKDKPSSISYASSSKVGSRSNSTNNISTSTPNISSDGTPVSQKKGFWTDLSHQVARPSRTNENVANAATVAANSSSSSSSTSTSPSNLFAELAVSNLSKPRLQPPSGSVSGGGGGGGGGSSAANVDPKGSSNAGGARMRAKK